MISLSGWGARLGGLLSMSKGPWGPSGGGSGGDGDGGDGEGGGPRSPWGQPPRRRKSGGPGGVPPSIDDFLRKSRERFGGRFPQQDGRPYWLYGLAIFALLWILFTSTHQIEQRERGIITRFGSYAGMLQPGIGFTFPSPIDRVQKVNVEAIRTTSIGSVSQRIENRILTGDQNIIDLAYSVSWNISDPTLYLFRIENPDETISEVAESAMRAVVAEISLDDAIGSGRREIEQRVAQEMQRILNSYQAGISIQFVAIKQSDPPAAVINSFKEVTAAQQDAQSYINGARAYALQLTAKAQGDAAAFDKVYAQYKLAPEVTRRRMYYETMERVLAAVDKTVVEAPGVTPYLALPDVQRRGQEAPAR
jgi:modulator of FtsH protease HflK